MTDNSNQIEFNADAARQLEAAYLTTDVIEQRLVVMRALDLRPGEHVLDIGSGPGLLAIEMARTVGVDGRVCGVDPAEAMLEMGRQRCSGMPQCGFEPADANALPFEDASFDAVVSTQVYEYVTDIEAAFGELYRVVKPGGRVCIVDTDYDSLVIHTRDPERMKRVLDAWDDHFVHADLPRQLGPALRGTGFTLGQRQALPMFNTEWHSNAFSYHLLPLMGAFAVGRGAITPEEKDGWLAEFPELAAEGGFFYSINRYVFVANRPG